MSYMVYRVKCDKCGYETQTAFGMVGTAQIAAPITECPTQFPSRSLDNVQRCGGKMIRVDQKIFQDNSGSFPIFASQGDLEYIQIPLGAKEKRVIEAARDWYKAWMKFELTSDLNYELATAVKDLDEENKEVHPSQDLQ